MLTNAGSPSKLIKSRRDPLLLTYLDKFVFCALGFFVFSPIGYYYTASVAGLFSPEPAFLAFLFYARKRFPEIFNLNKSATSIDIVFIVTIFALSFIGLISTNFDFISVYADVRAIFIAFIFYKIVRLSNIFDKDKIIDLVYYMCVSSIFSHLLFFKLISGSEDSVKNSYPIFMMLFICMRLFIKNNIRFLSALLALSSYIAITSFFRSNYIFVLYNAATLIVVIFEGGVKKINNLIFLLLFSFLSCFIFYYVSGFSYIYEYLSSNESRYIQSIGKFENLIDTYNYGTLGGGDDLRFMYIEYIIDNIYSLILPSGLGHRSIIDHWGSIWTQEKIHLLGSNSMDGLHLYMTVHFGLVVSIFFISEFSIKLFKSYKNKSVRYYIFHSITISVFLFYCMTTGSMLSITANSIGFGATLAMLIWKTPKK